MPTAFFVLPDFGTEPSWRLMLNRAFSEGWAFGDRVIWTYGPLGFLETRFPYGVSPWYYAGFDLLVLLLFFRLAIDVSKLKFDTALAWACVASLFTCKRLIHDQPSSALFVLIVYLLVRNLTRPGAFSSAALVAASVTGLLFKLNFGLVSLLLCGGVFLLKALARERSAGWWLLVVVLQVALAWLLAAQFNTNLAAYLKSSLLVIGQYSDAAAWGPGPGAVAHRVVVLFFLGYIALAALFLRKHGFAREPLVSLLIGAAAVFMLYKTAIVRGDYNHTKCFLLGFPLIALAFVVHAPESLRPLWRLLFLVSTAYSSMLMLAEFGNALIYMQPEYLKAFFPVNYLKGIQDYHYVADWKAYSDGVRRVCPERAVPENVLQLIGTNSVDVFPSETTLALGSGLNYQPRPVPQSYAAIHPQLQARDLAFLESDEAPRFILQVLGEKAASPDGRYTPWDEPAVLRLLRRQYILRLGFTNLQSAAPETPPKMSPILLLEREPREELRGLTELKEVKGGDGRMTPSVNEQAGSEFVLPEHEGELYARIKMKKTLLGRLVTFLYRGAPVHARFRLENGTTKEARVIPANLESGVLVNYFAEVTDSESARNYLFHQSRGNPRCVALQFDFDHSWEYRREFEVTYFHGLVSGSHLLESRLLTPAP
ncbi:MAG TPA: hypothetical protein VN578_08020 [Candidatus Binatia bacterium]|nr:hypothetical protein [Candidatus Binatia bacterium]